MSGRSERGRWGNRWGIEGGCFRCCVVKGVADVGHVRDADSKLSLSLRGFGLDRLRPPTLIFATYPWRYDSLLGEQTQKGHGQRLGRPELLLDNVGGNDAA